MDKQQILKAHKVEVFEAFKQAEIDWSMPIEQCKKNYSDGGLCYYFEKKGYSYLGVRCLSKYWLKYSSTAIGNTYHFYSRGCTFSGRQERLDAIRKVIQDLEEPTWIQKFLNKYFKWKK
jgi:hypothetical protein